MQDRWVNLKKNQSGSALPFVIILGLVLLIAVASLMTVATGGINFTQTSVESRQAYIDAKSVTEYGKILIEDKIAEMDDPANPLPPQNTDNTAGDIIFYINGTRSNPNDPLTLVKANTASSATIGVGKLKWKQTVLTGDDENGTATTIYSISVETQNLRRKLNYERTFDYKTETVTTPGTGGIPQAPKKPDLPSVDLNQFSTTGEVQKIDWKTINFKVVGGQNYGIGSLVDDNKGILTVRPANAQFDNCQINLTKIDFINEKTLDIAANQVAVTTSLPNNWKSTFKFGLKEGNTFKTDLLYFANGYKISSSTSTNTLVAKDIYIKGDLEIQDASSLVIDCDNLWITGTLNLNKNLATGKINAKNIIIDGDLKMNSSTTLIADCSNVWVNGQIICDSNKQVMTFKNVQYLKTSDINLKNESALTITGDPTKDTNQVDIGAINSSSSAQKINITDLYYFNCLGITQNGWSPDGATNIESRIVIIDGDLFLNGINANNFKILTEYFVCKGNATFKQLSNTFYIGNVNQKTSCIKFDGAYTQTDAKVVLYGNTNIVFGKNVTLANWGNNVIDLTSDNIYFMGSIDTQQNYTSNKIVCNGATDSNQANVLLKKATSNPTRDAGKYIGFTTKALTDSTLKPGSFDEISFPPEPSPEGTTPGTTSTTQVVVQGQEKYY